MRVLMLIVTLCVLLIGISSSKPIQLGDLPNSNIRTKISKLKGQAFDKAIGFLNRINFNPADASIYDVDNSGGVYAVDNKLPPEEAQSDETSNDLKAILSSDSYEPLALNPPILHSNPSASNKVWLNFAGYTISGTAWNSGRADPLVAKAFSTDADYTTFSASELAIIEDVWKRMSEDYRPFNVDVTTEKPATLGPNTAHVLFTENYDVNGNAMPSSGAGGVAYIGVYGGSYLQYYSPALVYVNNLSKRSYWMCEAGSHELGHNMGLSHDGSSSTTYYGGHGSGVVTWSAIMGNSYSKYVSQFSKGEYPDANQFEDDIQILTTKMGLRNDDHGDTNAAATMLVTSGNTGTGSGIIGTSTDVDVFRFEHGSVADIEVSIFSFNSGTSYKGGNLDPKVVLQDSNGNIISPTSGETDPQIATNVIVTFGSQPAGTYYVHVSASGVDGTSGYTTYGSLGYYDISVTYSAAVDSAVPTFSNFVANDITVAGSTSHDVTITYNDDIAISILSLADSNIKVTRDSDSTVMQVAYSSVDINSDGSPRQVTYSINAPAPDNVFDDDDNAIYTVEILANQVSDTAGNYVAAATVGTFTINVQPDVIPPEMTVSQQPNNILDDTTNPQFQLRFTDNSLVAVSTIDNNDIEVTGPGFTGFAQIVSKSPTTDSSTIDVTFQIATTFTSSMNGDYNINLVGNIQDAEGNNLQNNNPITTFTVSIPAVVEFNLLDETMETEPITWLFGNGWYHGLMSGPNVNAASNTLTVDGKYDEDVGERILQSESFNAEAYNQIIFEFDRMLDLGKDDVARVVVVVNGVETDLWVNSGAVHDTAFIKQQFDLTTLCAGKTDNYIKWILGPTKSVKKRNGAPTDGFGWGVRNVIVKGTRNMDPNVPHATASATDVVLPDIVTFDVFVEYYSTFGFDESIICGTSSPIQVVGARALPAPTCAPEGSSAIDGNENNRRVRYILTLDPAFGYADNGEYSIVVNDGQVVDKNAVFIAGGQKGSFIVDVAIPTNTVWEYDFEAANADLGSGWTYSCSEWLVGLPTASNEPKDRRSLYFADGNYDDSDPNKVCEVLSPTFSNTNSEFNMFELIVTHQLGVEGDDKAEIFYKCDGGSNINLFSNAGSKIQTSSWVEFRADKNSNFDLPLSSNCQVGIKLGPFSQQSSTRGKKTVTTSTVNFGWNIARINIVGMTLSNSEVVTPTPAPTNSPILPPTDTSGSATISAGVAAGVLVGLVVLVVIGFVLVGRRRSEHPIYTISAPVSGGQITLNRALGNEGSHPNLPAHRRRTSSFNGDDELELPRLSVYDNNNQQQQNMRRSISANNLPLPPNWFRLVDETGVAYYWNEKTGVSQWERPKVRLENDTIIEEELSQSS